LSYFCQFFSFLELLEFRRTWGGECIGPFNMGIFLFLGLFRFIFFGFNMAKLMMQFKQELLLRGYSQKKAEKYCMYIGLFFLWCHGSLEMFHEENFREFLNVMRNKGRSLYKIRQYKQIFRFFCLYVLRKERFVWQSKRICYSNLWKNK